MVVKSFKEGQIIKGGFIFGLGFEIHSFVSSVHFNPILSAKL
jgi:predicted membrane protein